MLDSNSRFTSLSYSYSLCRPHRLPAVRQNQVCAVYQLTIDRILFHVEELDRLGVVSYEEGLTAHVLDQELLVRALPVVSPPPPLALEQLDGVRVGHPLEWLPDVLQPLRVHSEDREVFASLGEHLRDHTHERSLDVLQKLLEVPPELYLEERELDEVPVVHLILRSEARASRPDLLKARRHDLEVELPRLREVPLLTEEVDLKHRRHVLARPRGSGDVGNSDFDEEVLLKVLPRSRQEGRLDSCDSLQARLLE